MTLERLRLHLPARLHGRNCEKIEYCLEQVPLRTAPATPWWTGMCAHQRHVNGVNTSIVYTETADRVQHEHLVATRTRTGDTLARCRSG